MLKRQLIMKKTTCILYLNVNVHITGHNGNTHDMFCLISYFNHPKIISRSNHMITENVVNILKHVFDILMFVLCIFNTFQIIKVNI